MIRSALLIFFVGLLAGVTGGQTTPPQPVATPETAHWTEFSPDGEEFTVEMPGTVSETKIAREKVKGTVLFANASYYCRLNGGYFFAFSEVLGVDSERSFPTSLLALKPFIDRAGATAEKTNIAGKSAETFVFSDSDGFFHNIVFVKTNERFYTFHTVAEEESNENARHFFKTLRFHKVVAPAKATLIHEASFARPPIKPNTMPGTAITGGSGIGPGASDPPKPVATGQSKGINLFSKPKSNYTDLARIYQIMGEVILRVTFKSDASIGEVAVTKKLPFGLTGSAIEAAKNMKFEPAIKSDAPVTVTKMVIYSFTLY